MTNQRLANICHFHSTKSPVVRCVAMKNLLIAFALTLATSASFAAAPLVVHQALDAKADAKVVALTLDACGGAFDQDVIDYLIAHRIPATIFATKRWIDRNPRGVAMLHAHRDLFQIENHGANHIPAVIGAGKRVYGIPGEPDIAHLKSEVLDGVNSIHQATGSTPRWYRGATAAYDAAAIETIHALGYRIAGFSLNADAGATLSRNAIFARLKAARSGDIIIAHMNKPASDSAEGLALGLAWLQSAGYRFVTLDQMPVRDLPGSGI